MKTLQNVKSIFLIALVVLAVYSCKNDDDAFVAGTETFQLTSVADSGIEGIATFTENEDGSTTVTLELTGLQAATTYPASIYAGFVGDPLDLLVTLVSVEGDVGSSVTVITQLEGPALSDISYDELMETEAYINIYDEGGVTVVANANILASTQ